jgi:hypothetical protein
MLDRWYKLAERYVVAVEESAAATSRIADIQAEGVDNSRRMVEVHSRTSDENASFGDFIRERIGSANAHVSAVADGLSQLAQAVAELRGQLAALKPSVSE